jgi:hypothetical protein
VGGGSRSHHNFNVGVRSRLGRGSYEWAEVSLLEPSLYTSSAISKRDHMSWERRLVSCALRESKKWAEWGMGISSKFDWISWS